MGCRIVSSTGIGSTVLEDLEMVSLFIFVLRDSELHAQPNQINHTFVLADLQ